jgi:NAD(P)-dependent dehydrogenase (short-subunit alcohol dehydrogenase family)
MEGTSVSTSLQERLFDVRDARVVVTGAASGIGYAMAEVLGDCGARVMLADVNPELLDDAMGRLAARGVEARSRLLDVADADAVRAVVDDVVDDWGGLDVVCANAGISLGPGDEATWKLGTVELGNWNRVLDVNLHGVFHTMQAAAAVMRPQGSGKIIVTASIAGLRPEPMIDYAYNASKAGVIALVRHAAHDLASANVQVNAIAPGPFRTRIATGELPGPEQDEFWRSLIPIGRMAETEELKGLILLLASPASSFITGATFPIDGGMLA